MNLSYSDSDPVTTTMTYTWQLQNPIDTIIFDCDGTLSTIEGIDELAAKNGASETVKALTAEAMNHLGMNLELYDQRLQLVKPTQQNVTDLANAYYIHQVKDIAAIISLLQRLQKNIFIVSAGLLPAVVPFGEKLQIPKQNIIAVDIWFDEQGHFKDFDRTSPLVTSLGKRIVINQIKMQHPELIFVGDGANDLAAIDLVNRFIGYGGAYYRTTIAENCDFYITSDSLTALLPLALTAYEYQQLTGDEKLLYQQGIQTILDKKVEIKK